VWEKRNILGEENGLGLRIRETKGKKQEGSRVKINRWEKRYNVPREWGLWPWTLVLNQKPATQNPAAAAKKLETKRRDLEFNAACLAVCVFSGYPRKKMVGRELEQEPGTLGGGRVSRKLMKKIKRREGGWRAHGSGLGYFGCRKRGGGKISMGAGEEGWGLAGGFFPGFLQRIKPKSGRGGRIL